MEPRMAFAVLTEQLPEPNLGGLNPEPQASTFPKSPMQIVNLAQSDTLPSRGPSPNGSNGTGSECQGALTGAPKT